jgi:hypothetical protein
MFLDWWQYQKTNFVVNICIFAWITRGECMLPKILIATTQWSQNMINKNNKYKKVVDVLFYFSTCT